MLQNLRSRIDKTGCGCGSEDCKITQLTAYERDQINSKFNTIYTAFSFNTRATDTRCDQLRWLGRNY